jgi:hypothetical protein
MRKITALILLVCPLVFGCREEDPNGNEDGNASEIFFDYRISGEEGRDSVTILAQFRSEDPEGPAISLEESGKIELDGEVLRADSANLTGPYYEIRKPLAGFNGKHRIVFTTSNGKKYIQEFSFMPISLQSELPETRKKDSFSIFLKDLKPGSRVRYVLTDTSFDTDDINEVTRISSSGRILFSKEKISKLSKGPVTLLLELEDERSVAKGTGKGGRISISYGLRRDFELVD